MKSKKVVSCMYPCLSLKMYNIAQYKHYCQQTALTYIRDVLFHGIICITIGDFESYQANNFFEVRICLPNELLPRATIVQK